jgi:hypothetical protein
MRRISDQSIGVERAAAYKRGTKGWNASLAPKLMFSNMFWIVNCPRSEWLGGQF